jgi:hypothetical protein
MLSAPGELRAYRRGWQLGDMSDEERHGCFIKNSNFFIQ